MNHIEEFGATIALEEYIRDYRNVDHFVAFCRECNGYGKTWACPPFDSAEDFETYNYANIFAQKIWIDPSQQGVAMSGEELREATKAILDPCRAALDERLLRLESSTPTPSRALFAGSCRCCPQGECTRLVGSPCVKPHMMRPSLEAMGFDVGRTASDLLGVELVWSSDSLPQYFTLVYALFTQEPLKK